MERGCAAREEVSLEGLIDAYGDGVLQLAYFYTNDRGVAEDIFQEVFTRVYLNLNRFRGEASPKTWIYRIVVNLCRDRFRSWAVRRVMLVGEEVLGVLLPPHPAVDDEVLAEAEKGALLQAITDLPLPFREVTLLYYYEEMETPEVARTLGLSEGTVRSRLYRARLKLKQVLEGGAAHE